MSSKNTDRRLILVARFSLAVASLIALVLTWLSLLPGAIDAAEASGIPALSSSYARVGPYPLSLGGLGVYVLLLVSSIPGIRARGGRLLAFAERAGCLVVLTFAVWLTAMQIGLVDGSCTLCTLAHVFAVIGALCTIRRRRVEGSFGAPDFAVSACVAAAVFNFVLIVQWLGRTKGEEWSMVTVPEARSGLSQSLRPTLPVELYGGRATIDVFEVPVLGPPRSGNRIYALIDPTDPQSRKFEPMLAGISESFGEDLAIVLAPGIRDAESEAIHRSLLAVWHHDRGSYSILREELVEGVLNPSRTHVERRATELVGDRALRLSYVENGDAIGRVIDFGRRLLVANAEVAGNKILPQLLVGERVLAGSNPDPTYYARIIEAQFGVEVDGALAAADGPALELVDGEMMQLGRLVPGSTRELEVMVRNRGSEALQIGWVKLPAGCALAQLPRSAIAAGAGGMIRIKWESPDALGPVQRTLFINHNGFGKQSKLTLLAHVVTATEARPAKPPHLISSTHGEPNAQSQRAP